MKPKFFIAVACIAATTIMAQAQAQENTQALKEKTTKKSVSVVNLRCGDGSCIVSFGEVATAKEAGSGMATGKRMHKPFVITKEFSVSAKDNAVTEITTPANAKSSTGAGPRVSVSDISFSIQAKGMPKTMLEVEDSQAVIPARCPNGACQMVASWSWGASNGVAPKRCEKTFVLTMEDGVCKGISENGKGIRENGLK